MINRIRSYILTVAVLLLIFLVTFYIRYSYLTYKVPSIEQGNIILLTSLENFFKRGIVNSYFSPVQTWSNEGEKSVNFYSSVKDYAGNNYYISHPPFTFMLTYAFFKILNLKPNEFTLQIIGLLLHLTGAFFVYLIILEYFDRKRLELFVPALVSYVTYLFIPVMMNLHLFHVFCETFVQPFWIFGIYIALKIFKERQNNVTKFELFILGLTLFLMIYTEWLGIFFSFSLCFICFYYSYKDKKYISVFYIAVVSSLAALLLILLQYSRIDGFIPLMESIYTNFIKTSTYYADEATGEMVSILDSRSYLLLLNQINGLMNGLGYFFLLMFLATVFITIRKRNFVLHLSQEVKYMIMLSLVPAVLYFIVFFNASLIHYIYIAKFAVPISIFIGIIYKKLILSFKQTTTFIIIFTIIKVAVVIVSIYLFFTKTPYDQNYTYLADVSEIIRNNTSEEDDVFININTKAYNPLVFLSYESKRNLTYAGNLFQAKKLIQDRGRQRGVFFVFNQKKNFYSINHFVNPND